MMPSYPTENTATGALNKSFSTFAEPQPPWRLMAKKIHKPPHAMVLQADTKLARPWTFIFPILSLLYKTICGHGRLSFLQLTARILQAVF